MPYILLDRRPVARFSPSTAGELNFAITDLLCYYLRYNKLSYQTLNDIVGALELAKAEFIVRVVQPYEKQKCLENTDVYFEGEK